MGLRDLLGRIDEQMRAELIARPGPPTEVLAPARTIEAVIADAIAAREADFTLGDALRMPPVIRAKTLLRSMASLLPPQMYRGGLPVPVEETPRVVRRPTGWKTRGEFVGETVDALIDVGEAFWLLGDRDRDNHPQTAIVARNADVEIEWLVPGYIPKYRVRGEPAILDRDVKHIAINRRPGELHGRGPLTEGLPYLAAIDAAETYAAGWYGSGGVPSVVLRTKENLKDLQSEELKAAWMASQSARVPTPAVLAGGVEDHYPGTDPERSQLNETRSRGATVVAQLLGIPGPLLLIETHGSTVTYQNATAALGELVKGTLGPTYLSPIEQAWSDLVSALAAIRFDYAELSRSDIAARFGIYAQGIPLGIFDAAEARAWEGLAPAGGAPIVPPAYAPVPRTREPQVSEVPAA